MRIVNRQELVSSGELSWEISHRLDFIGPMPKHAIPLQNLRNSELHARQSNRKPRKPRKRNLETELINSKPSEVLNKRELRELARENRKREKQANKIPKTAIRIGSTIYVKTSEREGIADVLSVDVYYGTDTSKRGNLPRKIRYRVRICGQQTEFVVQKSQIRNVLS